MTHHERAPWNTPEIKDAISYAMDRDRIGQIAADGWMVAPTAGPFYPGGTYDMPDDLLASIPGYDFSNQAANKDKARALLADAGYEPGELTMELTVWNISSIAAASVVVQEELESVGFNVEPLLLETSRAYQAWSDGSFDVGIHGFWVAGLDPDIVLYEHFYTGSDRNYNRYANVETDRLIDEMSGTVDPELRKQRAWDVAEIILRDHGKHILGYGSGIGGMQPTVGGYMYALNYLQGYGPLNRHQHVYLTN
jgi:ABC-type transport system substrate-binding protein